MMKARHNQRRIQKAEYAREQPAEAGEQSIVNHVGQRVAYLPADRAHHRMGNNHGWNQGAEGNDDHAHYLRAVLPEEFLQEYQHEACQHG